MERYAWKATVLPGKLDEYVRRHNAIWPELKEVLDELAFEHYPVAVDAGEGTKEFPSFDTAREYVRTLFFAPADRE